MVGPQKRPTILHCLSKIKLAGIFSMFPAANPTTMMRPFQLMNFRGRFSSGPFSLPLSREATDKDQLTLRLGIIMPTGSYTTSTPPPVRSERRICTWMSRRPRRHIYIYMQLHHCLPFTCCCQSLSL